MIVPIPTFLPLFLASSITSFPQLRLLLETFTGMHVYSCPHLRLFLRTFSWMHAYLDVADVHQCSTERPFLVSASQAALGLRTLRNNAACLFPDLPHTPTSIDAMLPALQPCCPAGHCQPTSSLQASNLRTHRGQCSSSPEYGTSLNSHCVSITDTAILSQFTEIQQ